MVYGRPMLKSRTNDRLHIAKEPGLLSWMILLAVGFTGIIVDYYIMPDYFLLHAGFLSLCLILSLNLMKTWDFVMDRDENVVTVLSRSWYHSFSMRVPDENVKRFPLTAITSVVLTPENEIDIITQDGSITKITSTSANYRCLRKLRREISTFLCLERIEYLKVTDHLFYEWDFDPWNISSILESQESDNETVDSNSVHEESQFQYGSNIKIIKGPNS